MNPTVELHRQPKLGTVKIDRVVVEGLLASKLEPREVSDGAADTLPGARPRFARA